MSVYWYRVEILSGDEPNFYFGSHEGDPDALLKTLTSGHPFRLRDTFYYDENNAARSWRDWDPNYDGSIIINAQHVISIMPMLNDPRKRGNEGGSGNRPVLDFPT